MADVVPGAMRVTVVVPVYGHWDLVERLLACLSPLPDDWEVVLIDDASPVAPPQNWPQDRRCIRLIRHVRNTGFAGAVNSGMEIARGEIICVLNSDVSASVEALHVLAEEASGEALILAPKSLSTEGRTQPVPRRFHTIPRLLAEYFVPLRLVPALDVRLRDFDRTALAARWPVEVDWAAGSCLVFDRRVWDLVGPMDRRFHMQSEEMDWQLTARERGVRVKYVPHVVVVHDDGGSTPAGDGRFLSIWRSHFLFMQKRRGPLAVLALRFGMIILYGLMVPGWKIAGVHPALREKCRQQRDRHRKAICVPVRSSAQRESGVTSATEAVDR